MYCMVWLWENDECNLKVPLSRLLCERDDIFVVRPETEHYCFFACFNSLYPVSVCSSNKKISVGSIRRCWWTLVHVLRWFIALSPPAVLRCIYSCMVKLPGSTLRNIFWLFQILAIYNIRLSLIEARCAFRDYMPNVREPGLHER